MLSFLVFNLIRSLTIVVGSDWDYGFDTSADYSGGSDWGGSDSKGSDWGDSNKDKSCKCDCKNKPDNSFLEKCFVIFLIPLLCYYILYQYREYKAAKNWLTIVKPLLEQKFCHGDNDMR